MEDLPADVIGNILSCLGAARNVMIASLTCRKWQEALRNHLHTLTFDSTEFHEFSTTRLEILITQTIFQTRGLKSLSIIMDDVDEFSPAPVIAWLMYTRDTLCYLHYNVRTTPNVNILEKCGREKLEVLKLAHNTVIGVEPSYQKFPCLKSLSLSYVSISAWDLSLLLAACPEIEVLNLVSLYIVMSDSHATMELVTHSLKDIYVEAVSLDKFILETDGLEKLHLRDCTLEVFELIDRGSLRFLKIDDVSVIHLEIGENLENLEVVDISNFTIVLDKFYAMISRSSELRKLRLWDVVFDSEDEVVDVGFVSSCFPLLSHLCLNYDLIDAGIDCGTFVLENVIVLELGWTVISEVFSIWLWGFLERCPRLRKLVLHGIVSETKTQQECNLLANFTSSVVRLARKYIDVEVQFVYE